MLPFVDEALPPLYLSFVSAFGDFPVCMLFLVSNDPNICRSVCLHFWHHVLPVVRLKRLLFEID